MPSSKEAPMQTILLNNFFLGGIADSEYVGIPNSMGNLAGLDIHGEPGVCKVQQATVLDSGSSIAAPAKQMIACSNGYTFMFLTGSGEVWARSALGVYTLVYSSVSGPILDAAEYNGYIYFATETTLYQWPVVAGHDWSTVISFASFLRGNSLFHPMIVLGGILLIGDGCNLAQVDDTEPIGSPTPVFTGDAEVYFTQYTITCVGDYSGDLLVGMSVLGGNVISSLIYRWNLYSLSNTSLWVMPESSINAFLPGTSPKLCSAGVKGNFYSFSAYLNTWSQFKRIPGNYSDVNSVTVDNNAAICVSGIPYIGVSSYAGVGPVQGVYSLGSYSANYPPVLNLEFVISTGNSANIEITSIVQAGSDILIAWVDYNGTVSYGVDKIDWSNKSADSFFETRKIVQDRGISKDANFEIGYRSMPANCSLTVFASTNNEAWVEIPLYVDAYRSVVRNQNKIPASNTLKFLVEFNTYQNTGPEVETMQIMY